MSVVLVILPLALLFVAVAVAAYVWAARSGQFDDTDTPASRVLVDDVEPAPRGAEPAHCAPEPAAGAPGPTPPRAAPGAARER